MPQSLAQVWLHVIFSTKERRPFFQNFEFREEMFRMLAHHVKEAKCVSASVGGYVTLTFSWQAATGLFREPFDTDRWIHTSEIRNSTTQAFVSGRVSTHLPKARDRNR